MKTKLNYFAILFSILSLFLTSCETESLTQQESQSLEDESFLKKAGGKKDFIFTGDCSKSSAQLYAGQHTLVGEITVQEVGSNYEITYNITNSGYCLTKTHLSVVEDPSDFPINGGGNPVNGAFEYSMDHDCVSSYTYEVPMSKGEYIAAHGVVVCKEETSLEDIASSLPESIEFCVQAKGTDAVDSYFDVVIDGEVVDAWCADVDKTLNVDHCVDISDVYSTYETIPAGIIENPENFPYVNWILNMDFIGTESPSGGTYTFGDIQWAIWEFLNDSNCISCAFLGDDWSATKGQEIYDLAMANGGDTFIPSCGDVLSVLIVPGDGSQPILITIEIPCNEGECEETIWAEGCSFPGNNWSSYFHYIAPIEG